MAAGKDSTEEPIGTEVAIAQTEAFLHMKARIADAQEMFDEAVEDGLNLFQALRYAARQIKAAMRAKVKYEAELLNGPAIAPAVSQPDPDPDGPEVPADLELDELEDEPDIDELEALEDELGSEESCAQDEKHGEADAESDLTWAQKMWGGDVGAYLQHS